MQLTKLKFRLLGVVGVALLTLTMVFVPQSTVQDIPNRSETQKITSTLIRFYELLDRPTAKLDVTQFSEVLLDSEEYQLTEHREEYLDQSGYATSSPRAGYLTAMQINYKQMKQIENQRSVLLRKAQAENRQITAAEWEELAGANNGKAVPFIYQSESQRRTQLLIHSITIDGERAVVRYDDQAALQEAVLIYKDGRWFVVDLRAIWIHF